MNHTPQFESYLPTGATPETDGALTLFAVQRANFFDVFDTLIQSDELRLQTITALDLRASQGTFRILYVFGHAASHTFLVPYFDTVDSFPSLAARRMQYSFYEREIRTMFGLTPEGHPDSRATMAQVSFSDEEYPLRADVTPKGPTAAADPLSTYEFHTVKGEGVYEIPVGPVHAGIIEPGHFRFSVLGEEIRKLDPLLGWKHKGIEKLFETAPLAQKIAISERVSGDSSFAHSLAFCQAVESLSQLSVPEHDRYLRVVFAELERVANHFSDIGFIMLDTAYTFGGAHGARLRERIMQWNERLTGSRFLRGVNTVGGVQVTPSREELQALATEVPLILKDFNEVIEAASQSLSLAQRLENTGVLTPSVVEDYGVVGVPARACGSTLDARKDFPYAGYDTLDFDVVTETTGDVNARFKVRVGEVRQSFELITQALQRLSKTSSTKHEVPRHLKKNAYAVSVVEGWRGDIVYCIKTDPQGDIVRVKVRDASFLNWQAFPNAAVGEMVPDFPLINKSFNLSYSGNDL